MTDWTAFAGFSGVVLTLLLLLAHASKGHLSPEAGGGELDRVDTFGDGENTPGNGESAAADGTPVGVGRGEDGDDAGGDGHADADHAGRDAIGPGGTAPTDHLMPGRGAIVDVPPTVLLVNVALSQGLFAGLLVVGVWVTGVPAAALGLDAVTPGLLAVGVGLGGLLYVGNEVGAAVGERVGIGGEETLREALAPETRRGWVLLLFVILPVIAGFEELLFRGALVGALAVGFGVSPWLLAALSSVAFALGHGAQGTGGIVVTGVLGFALAAAFVLTGSLLVVVVAHYLVNALSFVVHEGFGVDPLG